jgi:Xaa-Pro aminopeptidase
LNIFIFSVDRFRMLSELDGFMEKYGVEALVVYGDSTSTCPELAYLVRANIPRGGVYVKKRGEQPLLVVSGLDLNLAKKGVVSDVRTYTDYNLRMLQRRFGPGRGWAEMIAQILTRSGVGRVVAVGGRADVMNAIYLADFLRRRGFRPIGMAKPSILEQCRRRKDEWEIEQIRQVGVRTVEVASRLEKVLEEASTRNGLVYYEGRPLTTGALRRMVGAWCGELDLTLPEGYILAAGPSSSDPHASTEVDTQLREGDPLLFDIFPAGVTGYRYDFTRTYCVGRPKPALARMCRDVLDAQAVGFDALRQAVRCETPFLQVCRFFRRRGWPTVLEDPGTDRGFVHGLGHGVGLTIGEEPYLTMYASNTLLQDDVVTVEPGLYLPGFGGVRIEDCAVVGRDKATYLVEHRKALEF